MYPYLLKWPIELPSYFTLLMVAFMVGIILAIREAKRVGVDVNTILDFSLIVLIASILGARLLHVFVDGHFMDYVNMCIDPFKVDEAARYVVGGCTSDQMCDKLGAGNICNLANGKCYQQTCWAAIQFWRGGYVYYGGFIAAAVAGILFLRRKKAPLLKFIDVITPSVAIGLAIGRVGCFLAGCCFGKYTNSFLGFVFPGGSPAFKKHFELYPDIMKEHHLTHSLPVFPTQLYSVIGNFAIFLYLVFWVRKRQKYRGQLLINFLVLYSLFRFTIEFFRDDDRGIFGFFSTSQWISIFMITLSIFLWRKFKNFKIESKNDNSLIENSTELVDGK